jgi:hypothetical protein
LVSQKIFHDGCQVWLKKKFHDGRQVVSQKKFILDVKLVRKKNFHDGCQVGFLFWNKKKLVEKNFFILDIKLVEKFFFMLDVKLVRKKFLMVSSLVGKKISSKVTNIFSCWMSSWFEKKIW